MGFFLKKNFIPTLHLKMDIYLKDYGYMSVFTFEDGTDFRKVYDVFQAELKDEVKVFSSIFHPTLIITIIIISRITTATTGNHEKQHGTNYCQLCYFF